MMRQLASNPFPLVTKELIEQASRKRTYVIRTVYAIGLFVTFVILYSHFVQRPGFVIGNRALLGTGRMIFDQLVAIQLAAIYILLPATLAGAITEERERGSLQLLMLTRLSASQIVIQKLISRLIPMFTLILLSLPLFALAYSFGGIGKGDIWLAVYWLVLNGFYVGAFTLMISCSFRSTAQAVSAAYLLGAPVILMGIPWIGALAADGIAGLGSILGSESVYPFAEYVRIATRPPFEIYWNNRGAGGWSAWFYGFSPIAMGAIFLTLGCVQLKAHRHERRGSAALKFQRRLDSTLTEVNEAMGGIVLFRGREVPPGDTPILWRESRKRALGKLEYFVRALLVMEIPTAAIGVTFLVNSFAGKGSWVGLATMTIFFWIVASLSITICAVHLIPNERSQRTLDVLLTTPLSGREILTQKIRGLNRLKLLFAIPFMTCIFMRAYVEMVVNSGGRALFYIAVSGLTFLLYMALFSWLALWLGLKIRNRGRAALTAVLGLTLWCAVPLYGYGTWLGLLSPATLIRFSETPVAFYGSNVIVPAVVNYALYAALWAWVRHYCLANADRLLGRTPVKEPGPRFYRSGVKPIVPP